MDKKLVAVLLGGAALLLAAAWFFLSPPDRSKEITGLLPAGEDREAAPAEKTDSTPTKAEISRERVAPTLPEAPPEEENPAPAAYRKALGGIRGRVVEEGGKPLSGLAVELLGAGTLDFVFDARAFAEATPPDLRFRHLETVTGEDGRFLLQGIYTRALYGLCIDPGGPRSFTRILDRVPGPGETVDLGDIVLAKGAVLIGRVVDENSRSVAGARVRAAAVPPIVFLSGIQDFRKGGSFLFSQGGKEFAVVDPPPALLRLWEMLPVPTTRTDGEGRFRLEGISRGMVSVVADKPGLCTAVQGPVSVSGGENDMGRIVLEAGDPARGRVVDPRGKPVAGAEVRAGSIRGIDEVVVLQPPVFTDAEGRFEIPGYPSHPAVAVARRYPEDAWTRSERFNPFGGEAKIVLPPAYDLQVEVVQPDGKRAARAILKLRVRDLMGDVLFFHPPRDVSARLERPEAGLFRVKKLPPGRYDLLLTAPGYAVKVEHVTVKDGPVEKRVVLEPALTARVRVLDKDTEKPVEWAEVYTTQGEDDLFLHPTRVSRARTDAEGRAQLGKMRKGTYNLFVSHPGYALAVEKIEVPAEEERRVLLIAGGTVEGRVYGRAADWDPPYMIVLMRRGEMRGLEDQVPRFTLTDLEGTFRVTGLSPGRWSLRVRRRLPEGNFFEMGDFMDSSGRLARTTVEVESGQVTRVEIDLDAQVQGPVTQVSGRVYLNGAPAAGALVTCRSKGSHKARVDVSGNYLLDRVPVGRCTLQVGDLPAITKNGGFILSRPVTLVENVPAIEDFDIRTGAITGRLVPAPGMTSPVKGRGIAARLTTKKTLYSVDLYALTDAAGRFRFDMVPEGTYRIESSEENLVCTPVTGVQVTAGTEAGPVTLVAVEPILVQGRLVLPEEGETFSWLFLMIEPKEGTQAKQVFVRVDKESGAFETRKLLPGAYTGVLLGVKKPLSYAFTVPPGGITGLVLEPKAP